MNGFGWNFYGFFVFAVAFIAVYFAWARRMAHRDREAQGPAHGAKRR